MGGEAGPDRNTVAEIRDGTGRRLSELARVDGRIGVPDVFKYGGHGLCRVQVVIETGFEFAYRLLGPLGGRFAGAVGKFLRLQPSTEVPQPLYRRLSAL